MVVTPAHIQGGVVGMAFMALLLASIWVTHRPRDELIRLAECDGRGWVTVRFPDGGEFMCTPTEQKPLEAQPNVRKFKRSKKVEKIEAVSGEVKPLP